MNSQEAKNVIGRKHYGLSTFEELPAMEHEGCLLCLSCGKSIDGRSDCWTQFVTPTTVTGFVKEITETTFFARFHRACRESIGEHEAAARMGDAIVTAWPEYIEVAA